MSILTMKKTLEKLKITKVENLREIYGFSYNPSLSNVCSWNEHLDNWTLDYSCILGLS